MKSKKQTILAAVALLLLVGCGKDTESTREQSADSPIALRVSSGIQTRAYGDQWESNDAIGIYMLNGLDVEVANQNYLTRTGGSSCAFAPASDDQTIYFPVDGSTRDFVAYYPYTTLGSNNLYPVNVAEQTSQKKIDLMSAEKVIGKSKTNPDVAFSFEHKLTKLVLTFKGDGKSITDEQLAGTVVKITNQQTAGTYNVVLGGSVAAETGVPSEITLRTGGLTAEGIVLPSDDTEGMNLTFTVPAPINQTFSWAVKSAPKSQQFVGGKKYKYTVTIAKVGVNVTSVVTDWLPGNGGEGENGSAE